MGVGKKVQELWEHPDELAPLLQMASAARQAKRLPQHPGLAFCYDMLNRVSRSFAIVTQQLPQELRDVVCVFYLVLRALDTIEDDMAIPEETKVPLLLSFHEKITDRSWSMTCGTGEYVRLMTQYPTVTDVYLGLNPLHQKVIADITKRMGAGMAEFIPKEVVTIADYDRYCHYVAGVVGIGLSQLFALSGLERPEFADMEEASNHMGLLLQKTNIIRDYLEDICEEPAPRMFWPRAVWGKYADSLEEFKDPANAEKAVQCLNELVTDALRHVPHCLAYMEGLRDMQVFRFCAIPQVMAIGTLALCYNNPRVFTGVVKMRRGLTAKYMRDLNALPDVYAAFKHFSWMVAEKVEVLSVEQGPSAKATLAAVATIQKLCDAGLTRAQDGLIPALRGAPPPKTASGGVRLGVVLAALLFFLYSFHIHNPPQLLAPPPEATHLHRIISPQQFLAVLLLVAALYWAATRRR